MLASPTSAHPDPEADLKVLAPPDVKAGVVATQLEEEVAGDCEEPSGHGGGGDGGGG